MKTINTFLVLSLINLFTTPKALYGQAWSDCDTVRTYLIEFNNDPADSSVVLFESGLDSVSIQTGVPIVNLGNTIYDYALYESYFDNATTVNYQRILSGDDAELPTELQMELSRIQDEVRADIIFLEIPSLGTGGIASTPQQLPYRRAIFEQRIGIEQYYRHRVGHLLLHLLGIYEHVNDVPNLMYFGTELDSATLTIIPEHVELIQAGYRAAVFSESEYRSCSVLSTAGGAAAIALTRPVLTSDQTTITFQRALIGSTYAVYALNGAIVEQGLLTEAVVDISTPPSGLCIVTVSDGDYQSQRIVK